MGLLTTAAECWMKKKKTNFKIKIAIHFTSLFPEAKLRTILFDRPLRWGVYVKKLVSRNKKELLKKLEFGTYYDWSVILL